MANKISFKKFYNLFCTKWLYYLSKRDSKKISHKRSRHNKHKINKFFGDE